MLWMIAWQGDKTTKKVQAEQKKIKIFCWLWVAIGLNGFL